MNFKPLIQELGIDKLPEEKQQVILGHVFGLLQQRMSMRLANQLTEEQLAQIEAVAKNGDSDAAMDELERVYPNFKQAYQEELDKLKADLQAILPR